MVQPRNASTVVLLRPADNDAFEILLTRRSPQMPFLGGYYVFPGGAVHRDDYSAKVLERCRGLGVLLCLTESGDEVDLRDPSTRDRFELKRRAIVKNELDVGSFLESENLICDLSRVVYFDHWVTPAIYSVRFDTRFYIAKLPNYQVPLAASEEVIDSLWVSPQDALSRINRHDFPILPPTTTVLGELGRIGSWRGLHERFHLV
jgi:8-oxo-dGTP pyrophosphatase MutT (NUDIX family)